MKILGIVLLTILASAVFIIAFAAIIEVFFYGGRFVWGMQAGKYSTFTAPAFLKGIRTHHLHVSLIVGILVVNVALVMSYIAHPSWWLLGALLLTNLCWAFALSDVLHHLILWIKTGDSEFDLIHSSWSDWWEDWRVRVSKRYGFLRPEE